MWVNVHVCWWMRVWVWGLTRFPTARDSAGTHRWPRTTPLRALVLNQEGASQAPPPSIHGQGSLWISALFSVKLTPCSCSFLHLSRCSQRGIERGYIFTFVNSFLHSFHKISVVTSEYKKQHTVFHCGLSYPECGTKSVKELQKIDSLTRSVLHEYT